MAGSNDTVSGGYGSCIKNNLKLLSVAALCFVGGGLSGRSGGSYSGDLSRRNIVRPMSISEDTADADGAASAAPLVKPKLTKAEPSTNKHANPIEQINGPSHDTKDETIITAARREEQNKKPSNLDEPVKQIILLGERHGGTNWITDHLTECFGGDLKVSNHYTRFKHWFQDEDVSNVPENSAVVVAMFRDPYDWVEAMRIEPHHALDHIDMPPRSYNLTGFWRNMGKALQWEEFVTKSWIGNIKHGGPMDANITKTGGRRSAKCMEGYSFVNIAPCSQQDSRFLGGLGDYKYELHRDGSGRAYDSIVNLRRDKIINHLSVARFSGTRAFFPYRFEDLNTNGTAGLLKNLEEATGLKAKCTASMGKMQHRRLGYKKITKHKELPGDYVKWMNRFVDWDVENRIGYFKRGE